MKDSDSKIDWEYGGEGGYDTDTYCLNGACRNFVGLRQIWHYGLFRLDWWCCFLYKKFVIEKRK